ncbi:hypothetical protein L7F22_017055 [Adiantum nelumboides]|nr:hypothetical protein [Adiantum nelumboides]
MACTHFIPECTFLSCPAKTPRALSGWHASKSDAEGFRERLRCRGFAKQACNSAKGLEISCSGFKCDGHGFTQSQRGKNKSEPFCCNSSEKEHVILSAVTEETLWEDLKPAILYLPSMQLKRVRSALKLAFEAHDGQKRKSGEPFIIHPVEVARILGELELDWETLAAGLLHDTVEDTNLVTFARIEEEFGPVVRRIVEGETKVSKLGKLQCGGSTSVSRDVKADDLRQMFLAMTEEVRVIIVKLADRLHNMRTLMHMPPHKQKDPFVNSACNNAVLAAMGVTENGEDMHWRMLGQMMAAEGIPTTLRMSVRGAMAVRKGPRYGATGAEEDWEAKIPS